MYDIKIKHVNSFLLQKSQLFLPRLQFRHDNCLTKCFKEYAFPQIRLSP